MVALPACMGCFSVSVACSFAASSDTVASSAAGSRLAFSPCRKVLESPWNGTTYTFPKVISAAFNVIALVGRSSCTSIASRPLKLAFAMSGERVSV